MSTIFPLNLFAQPMFSLPEPGAMISLSANLFPAILRGVKVNPAEPFTLEFILDVGENKIEGEKLEEESKKLIKYFLASLAVPEEDLWVNLSPYEKDRIVPHEFGTTEMGRDMLAQDYLLKQLTASMMYPEKELGQEFWDEAYDEIYKKFGTTDVPTNTFNKVWIVPDKAVVYEHGDSAFVVKSRLKVMLAQDYKAQREGEKVKESAEVKKSDLSTSMTSKIIKQIIIPAIEHEVNDGEHFANLRQIYNSLILAEWFKRNLKESLLGQIYVGKNKVKGVDIKDKNAKQKIYEQYLESFKKGVYNYIKEDYDPSTQSIVTRKYFSGGISWELKGKYFQGSDSSMLSGRMKDGGDLVNVVVNLLSNDSANAKKYDVQNKPEAKLWINAREERDHAQISLNDITDNIKSNLGKKPLAAIVTVNDRDVFITDLYHRSDGERFFKVQYKEIVYKVDADTGKVSRADVSRTIIGDNLPITAKFSKADPSIMEINIEGHTVAVDKNNPVNKEVLKDCRRVFVAVEGSDSSILIYLRQEGKGRSGDFIVRGKYETIKGKYCLTFTDVKLDKINFLNGKYNLKGLGLLTSIFSKIREVFLNLVNLRIEYVSNKELRKSILEEWNSLLISHYFGDKLEDVETSSDEPGGIDIPLDQVKKALGPEYNIFKDEMNQAFLKTPYGLAFKNAGFIPKLDFDTDDTIGVNFIINAAPDLLADVSKVQGTERIAEKRKEVAEDNAMASKFDDLILATHILSHGGPLGLDERTIGFRGMVLQIVDSLKNYPDFNKNFNENVYKAYRLVQKYRKLKRTIAYAEYVIYANKTFDGEWIDKRKQELTKEFNTSDELIWMRRSRSEFVKLVDELILVLEAIVQTVDDMPFKKSSLKKATLKNMENIYTYANDFIGILGAINLFLSVDGKQVISWNTKINDLEKWLGAQIWQSKGKNYTVTLNASNESIPVKTHDVLLHLALERLISNGFHETEDNEKNLSPSEKVVKLMTSIEPEQDNKKYVQISVINPGRIKDISRLFVVNHNRFLPHTGLGTPFVKRIIEKLGGSISSENIKNDNRDYVEFKIKLPRDNAIADNNYLEFHDEAMATNLVSKLPGSAMGQTEIGKMASDQAMATSVHDLVFNVDMQKQMEKILNLLRDNVKSKKQVQERLVINGFDNKRLRVRIKKTFDNEPLDFFVYVMKNIIQNALEASSIGSVSVRLLKSFQKGMYHFEVENEGIVSQKMLDHLWQKLVRLVNEDKGYVDLFTKTIYVKDEPTRNHNDFNEMPLYSEESLFRNFEIMKQNLGHEYALLFVKGLSPDYREKSLLSDKDGLHFSQLIVNKFWGGNISVISNKKKNATIIGFDFRADEINDHAMGSVSQGKSVDNLQVRNDKLQSLPGNEQGQTETDEKNHDNAMINDGAFKEGLGIQWLKTTIFVFIDKSIATIELLNKELNEMRNLIHVKPYSIPVMKQKQKRIFELCGQLNKIFEEAFMNATMEGRPSIIDFFEDIMDYEKIFEYESRIEINNMGRLKETIEYLTELLKKKEDKLGQVKRTEVTDEFLSTHLNNIRSDRYGGPGTVIYDVPFGKKNNIKNDQAMGTDTRSHVTRHTSQGKTDQSDDRVSDKKHKHLFGNGHDLSMTTPKSKTDSLTEDELLQKSFILYQIKEFKILTVELERILNDLRSRLKENVFAPEILRPYGEKIFDIIGELSAGKDALILDNFFIGKTDLVNIINESLDLGKVVFACSCIKDFLTNGKNIDIRRLIDPIGNASKEVDALKRQLSNFEILIGTNRFFEKHLKLVSLDKNGADVLNNRQAGPKNRQVKAQSRNSLSLDDFEFVRLSTEESREKSSEIMVLIDKVFNIHDFSDTEQDIENFQDAHQYKYAAIEKSTGLIRGFVSGEELHFLPEEDQFALDGERYLDKSVYMQDHVVDPEYQQIGIGSKLQALLFRQAKVDGYRYVSVVRNENYFSGLDAYGVRTGGWAFNNDGNRIEEKHIRFDLNSIPDAVIKENLLEYDLWELQKYGGLDLEDINREDSAMKALRMPERGMFLKMLNGEEDDPDKITPDAFTDEQQIQLAESALGLVEKVKAWGAEVVMFDGGSSPISIRLFVEAWKKKFADNPMPKVVIIDKEIGKYYLAPTPNEFQENLREGLKGFSDAYFEQLKKKKIAFIDDYAGYGVKAESWAENSGYMGFEKFIFLTFVSSHPVDRLIDEEYRSKVIFQKVDFDLAEAMKMFSYKVSLVKKTLEKIAVPEAMVLDRLSHVIRNYDQAMGAQENYDYLISRPFMKSSIRFALEIGVDAGDSVVQVGASGAPWIGLALALEKGARVKSINLNIMSSAIDSDHASDFKSLFEKNGGAYEAILDDYLEVDLGHASQKMVIMPNVLDELHENVRQKMIRKAISDIQEGGYFVVSFYRNLQPEKWRGVIEDFLNSHDIKFDLLDMQGPKSTGFEVSYVFKILSKPVDFNYEVEDQAMAADNIEGRWTKDEGRGEDQAMNSHITPREIEEISKLVLNYVDDMLADIDVLRSYISTMPILEVIAGGESFLQSFLNKLLYERVLEISSKLGELDRNDSFHKHSYLKEKIPGSFPGSFLGEWLIIVSKHHMDVFSKRMYDEKTLLDFQKELNGLCDHMQDDFEQLRRSVLSKGFFFGEDLRAVLGKKKDDPAMTIQARDWSLEEAFEFYNKTRKDSRFALRPIINRFFKKYFDETTSVLEVGSGRGELSNLLDDRTKSRLVVSDISEKNMSNHTPAKDRFVFDARNIPFFDSSFSSLTSYTFLNSLFEPQLVVDEISRILKDKGTMISFIDLLPNRRVVMAWRKNDILFPNFYKNNPKTVPDVFYFSVNKKELIQKLKEKEDKIKNLSLGSIILFLNEYIKDPIAGYAFLKEEINRGNDELIAILKEFFIFLGLSVEEIDSSEILNEKIKQIMEVSNLKLIHWGLETGSVLKNRELVEDIPQGKNVIKFHVGSKTYEKDPSLAKNKVRIESTIYVLVAEKDQAMGSKISASTRLDSEFKYPFKPFSDKGEKDNTIIDGVGTGNSFASGDEKIVQFDGFIHNAVYRFNLPYDMIDFNGNVARNVLVEYKKNGFPLEYCLEDILQELIKNAYEHMQGGKIRVNVREAEAPGMLRLQVENDGVIPETIFVDLREKLHDYARKGILWIDLAQKEIFVKDVRQSMADGIRLGSQVLEEDVDKYVDELAAREGGETFLLSIEGLGIEKKNNEEGFGGRGLYRVKNYVMSLWGGKINIDSKEKENKTIFSFDFPGGIIKDNTMGERESSQVTSYKPQVKNDHAMSADKALIANHETQTTNKGGIDFNPNYLNLETKKDGNGVPLPLQFQPKDLIEIDGLTPVIIQITPISNLPLFLGLKADPESSEQKDAPVLSKGREIESLKLLEDG